MKILPAQPTIFFKPLLPALLFFLSTGAAASPELDRQFALETVGYLRAWDNVDGLFGDYVSNAYKDYFSRQTRFVPQDLGKADAILAQSKLPYGRLIEDEGILRQLARSSRSESLLRTKVTKEGYRYRFAVDWIHSARMDLLAQDSFTLELPPDSTNFGAGEIRSALHSSVERLIKKLPFVGQVTGRDGESVTVNAGNADTRLIRGDTLVLGTLEEVRKHPLLKSIAEWRTARTGRVEVEEVDGGMAFCKVIEEEPNRPVARYQKVIQIIPRPLSAVPVESSNPGLETVESRLSGPPKFGWGAGGLWLGAFSREFTAAGGATGKDGGGILFGARADGQLWFNREWFAELGLGYGFSSYSQDNVPGGSQTSAGSVSASVFQFRIDGGYTYFTTPDFFGPKAYLRAGYKTTKYSLPTNTTESTAPVAFSSPFLSVGGDLPIRGNFGALINFDFGFFTSVTDKSVTGTSAESVTDLEIFIGGYYRWQPRITFRAGLDVVAQNVDYANGTSVSHRIITIGPSLVYYF